MRICLESKSHHIQMLTDAIDMLVSSELRPLLRPFPRSLPNHFWMLIYSESDPLHIQVCKFAPLNTNQLRVQFTSPSNVQGSVLSVQASVLKVWNYFTLTLNHVRMQICSESDLLHIQMCWELHLNADLFRGQTYLTTQCVVSSTATPGD